MKCILQTEPTQCGAAALATILTYYGAAPSLQEVSAACCVSEHGSTLLQLATAAQQYGFEAKAYRYSAEQLETLPLPLLLHWERNHFLVLTRITKRSVTLYDPAIGIRRLSRTAFEQSYSGYCLSLKQTAAFQRATWRERHIKGHSINLRLLESQKRGLLLLAAIGLVAACTRYYVPLLSEVLIDQVLLQQTVSIPWFLLLLCGMSLLYAGCLAAERLYAQHLKQRASGTLRRTMMQRILTAPLSFAEAHTAGLLCYRLGIAERFAVRIVEELAPLGVQLTTLCVVLAVLWSRSPLLTLVGAVMLLLGFFPCMLLGRTKRIQMEIYMRAEERQNALTLAGLTMHESMKAGGTTEAYFSLWRKAREPECMYGYAVQCLEIGYQLLTELFSKVLSFVLLAVGVQLVVEGRLTAGLLLGFQGVFGALLSPVSALYTLGMTVQELQVEGSMVRALLPEDEAAEKRKTEVPQGAGKQQETQSCTVANAGAQQETQSCAAANAGVQQETQSCAAANAGVRQETKSCAETSAGIYAGLEKSAAVQKWDGYELRAEHLSFTYTGDGAYVLDGISLTLRKGECIGISGKSGCGKSTLAKLLAGQYMPTGGKLWFAGGASDALLLNGKPTLFSGTIEENITLFEQPNQAALQRAVSLAQVPAARGATASTIQTLSAGQAARVELAAAFYKKPRLLLLDEATAALDEEAERYVLRAWKETGCTIVIISQQPRAFAYCDRCFLLTEGRLYER